MKKINLGLGIKLLVVCSLTLPLNALWQIEVKSETVSYSQINPKLKVTFEPPGDDQPQASTGGASRGNSCSVGENYPQKEMISLTPHSQRGLTLASHPTLMVYIPQTSVTKVFLSLKEIDGQTNYQTIIPIKGEPGIVRVTLPQEAAGLEVGKNYQWSIVGMCNDQLRPDSPLVQGQIKRIEADAHLREQLNNATLLERAVLYGQAGIWYETIATLAQLRLENPSDRELLANWEELLTSVGLANITKVTTIN